MSTRILPRIECAIMSGYDIDDVDGAFYMLNHALAGCMVFRFNKRMREDIIGNISCDGTSIHGVAIVPIAGGAAQLFGVPVREICREYDREYILHIEGYQDMDGNIMEPFDYSFRTYPRTEPDLAYIEHDELAKSAACEGIVLLKNEQDILPLPKNEEIFVWGDAMFRLGAVGAGKITPRYSVTLQRAIEESSLVVTENCETAVVVISRASGENIDNNAISGEYYLSDEETAQIISIREKYKRVIAILNTGYPIDVKWLNLYDIDVALWCGFPGMLGGQAVVEVLTGVCNPSGKLPDTWSNDYWDIPSSKNFYQPEESAKALDTDCDIWMDTCYEEDIYVGYRYFETFGEAVAFPFGFGLSYTEFTINVNCSNIQWRDEFIGEISIRVANSGKRAGKEVVQLYVSIPDGRLEQPSKRLIGFVKTKELVPGEEQEVILAIDQNKLTSYDERKAAWILEEGKYDFFIGNSIKALQSAGSAVLERPRLVKQVVNRMQPCIPFQRLSKWKKSYPVGCLSGVKKEVHELVPKREINKIKDCILPEDSFVDELSQAELARISICASTGWGMHQEGEAGRVYKLEGKNMQDFVVTDGNNGLNLKRKNIGMPSSNLVCATWNSDLAYQIGVVIAAEAKENKIQMVLAPALNIHRNPLNGRHPEYFSEDPYLAGIMAGKQSKGLEDSGVSSCMKHVACNNAETVRKRNQTIVSERALREIYLKAFEIAMEIQNPDAIMTGYNAVNGCFAAEDEELLQGIFREEFGFQGFVMTDWNSYDTVDIARAIQAGNCWITPGSMDDTYVKPVLEGIESGVIDESRLRQNVKYLCRVIRSRKAIRQSENVDGEG